MKHTLVYEPSYDEPFRLGQFRLTIRECKGRGRRAKLIVESDGLISLGPDEHGSRPIAVIRPLGDST